MASIHTTCYTVLHSGTMFRLGIRLAMVICRFTGGIDKIFSAESPKNGLKELTKKTKSTTDYICCIFEPFVISKPCFWKWPVSVCSYLVAAQKRQPLSLQSHTSASHRERPSKLSVAVIVAVLCDSTMSDYTLYSKEAAVSLASRNDSITFPCAGDVKAICPHHLLTLKAHKHC